jgi:hypothetical protein
VNPELVFRRELVLANCREDVTVEKVLSFLLNLFAFIDCNKGMSYLIRVVLEISKNGQCLYYRNVLFQLMYKICLTVFLTGKSLLVLVKILLDFSAITLPNIFVRTVLSKKGNQFTWPVYFLILKQLKCCKCSENRLGSTVPFCLFDRVLNVISIKDIDDNGCKLKTRDTHKTKLKCRSGDTVNPELVFRRELILANCREDVTVEKVLSFPIGPIPT